MMTPEELDEARAKEAGGDPMKAARLARENWTPPEPEPVDPDVLAARKWLIATTKTPQFRKEVLAGAWDKSVSTRSFAAGARMAREQERERAKVLDECLADLETFGPDDSLSSIPRGARAARAKYRGEA